jgi:hypothetical protein
MAVLPVLLTTRDIPESMWIHDESSSSEQQEGGGTKCKYLSREELMQEGLLFVEAFRNKSSICKKK